MLVSQSFNDCLAFIALALYLELVSFPTQLNFTNAFFDANSYARMVAQNALKIIMMLCQLRNTCLFSCACKNKKKLKK